MIDIKKIRMKALVASVVVLAFTDIVLEPSDIARATIYPHSFKSKHHTKHTSEEQRA